MYIAITEQHVKERMSDAEAGALDDAGQEGGYISKLPGLIIQITALVRGYVQSWRGNVLAPSGIPEECLHHAVSLIRHSLLASIPLADTYTEARQIDMREAYSFLNKVASGEIVISPPEGQSGDTALCWASEPRYCF